MNIRDKIKEAGKDFVISELIWKEGDLQVWASINKGQASFKGYIGSDVVVSSSSLRLVALTLQLKHYQREGET